MNQSTGEAKKALRGEMLARRRRLPADSIAKGSEAIAAHFCAWPVYREAKIMMVYLAMADEPQTDRLIADAWAKGKTVCVPLMGERYGHMEAGLLTGWDDLIIGRLGLKMPDPAKVRLIEPATIDLIAVPGVVFDRRGYRVGMGAGYYDRFLPRATAACRLGLAWSLQVVDAVPADEYDAPLDYLLTEGGFWSLDKGKS
jgi:5-formyltetrahydrofolate cyclo-ligase